METFNNVKGDYGIIRHEIGTWFAYNIKIQSIDENGTLTDFDLSDYTTTFKIYDKENGTLLHTCTVTVSGSVVSIAENIPITRSGNLYFEVKHVNTTDTDKIYKSYYGVFESVK